MGEAGGLLVQRTVELGHFVIREEGVEIAEGSEGEGRAPGQHNREQEEEVEGPGPGATAEVCPPPERVPGRVLEDVLFSDKIDRPV